MTDTLNETATSVRYYTPGELFLDAPDDIRQRIELIIGDSATIDLSHLYGKMGMVLVDAGHSCEACLRDSELAFRLVRPGGLVLWITATTGRA